MADRNTLKIADAADLADDDPFAELTRIMGFDPREPAKLTPAAKLGPVVNPGQPQRPVAPPLEDIFGAPEPEAAAPARHDDVLDDLIVENEQAAADESLQADFSIDLEQELMGGLDFDALGDEIEYASEPEEEVRATSGADAYAAQAEDQEPRYRVEPQFDADFELADNLDDALVEAVGHEPEAETQWQDRAVAVDVSELIGSAAPVANEPVLASHDEQSAFDRDIDARFDMLGDFEFEGDKPEAASVAAVEPVAEAFAPAEVDAAEAAESLDFVLHEDELRLDDDAFQLDIEPQAAAAPEVEPLANDFLEGDMEGDYAPASHAPVEAVAAEPQDYAADEEIEATSYERIEAGKYQGDNVAGYEAASAGYEPEAYEEVEPEPAPAYAAPVYQRASYSAPSYAAAAAQGHAPIATAAPSHGAVEPARVPAQDFDFALEDELNALLGNTSPSRTAQPAYVEPTEVEADESLSWSARDEALQAAVAVDAQAQDYDGADYTPAMKDYSLPAAGGEDDFVDFDHDAFDAAIAKGFDGDELDMFAENEAAAPVADELPMPVIDRATPKVDPLQTIEALSAHYGTPGAGPAYHAPAAYQDVPEIETIEVSDRAIALADDLDIPEIPQQEEFPPISAYDDLDSEFAGLLHDMNTPEAAAQRPTASSSAPFADPVAAPAYDYAAAAASVAAISAATLPLAGARPVHNEAQGTSGDFDFSDTRAPAGGQYQTASFDYDPQLDDGMSIPATQLAEERPRSRRGMMIAAVVGGVAVLGGVGAFMLSFGDSNGSASAPVVVKADETPIKVRPTNPGGSTVPNQESKVYDAVRGTDANGAPQQEKLVTTAEEPVDMTPPAVEEDVAASDDTPAMSGAPKGEDRIEQIVNDAASDSDTEVAAVAPRKVRTMVVRPDGTLVPREDPAPVAAAAPVAPPEAPKEVAATEAAPPTMRVVEPESTGTVAEQPAAAVQQPAPAADDVPAQPAPVARQSSTTPDVAPVAPQRPSEQPVQIVGEVKADQVAALAPAATAAGSWSMQIASQPSEAAAQSSYQDLLRRYGSVLNGRQANIVKAEIAGKGTFWRVRVPANSRNDAIKLCESYKAAGGNCFVSR